MKVIGTCGVTTPSFFLYGQYVCRLARFMILKSEMDLINTAGNIQVQMHLFKFISGDDGAS
ncbi:hypothetical protein Fmac_011454 [Flemingia macrophylla]|uniref:Uncharacterized protein n=1 Tax=Flemingia macrophylla TaxID=520843 RepID=A0ABD1MN98_9FABA